MTLQEFFVAVGGDYEDVMGRLGSEKLILKFVLRMPEDPTFQLLKSGMESGNAEEAFRAAHTLKGVCLNLGLDALGNSSHALTEALRPEKAPDLQAAWPLYEQVAADFAVLDAAVQALKQG